MKHRKIFVILFYVYIKYLLLLYLSPLCLGQNALYEQTASFKMNNAKPSVALESNYFTISPGNIPVVITDGGEQVFILNEIPTMVPENARITRIDYYVFLGVREVGNTDFKCNDYIIALYCDNSPGIQNKEYPLESELFDYNLWWREGDSTDQGLDDDTANDYDIYFNYRQTNKFNGENVHQNWYVYVKDCYSNGFLGSVKALALSIYWEPTCPDTIFHSVNFSPPSGTEGMVGVTQDLTVAISLTPASYGILQAMIQGPGTSDKEYVYIPPEFVNQKIDRTLTLSVDSSAVGEISYEIEVRYRHAESTGPISGVNECDIVSSYQYVIVWNPARLSFYGTVKDHNTLELLEGAQLSWGENQAQTNALGEYSFDNVLCGTNDLIVAKERYQTFINEDYAPTCLTSTEKNIELIKECPSSIIHSAAFSPDDGSTAPIGAIKTVDVNIDFESAESGVLQTKITGGDSFWIHIPSSGREIHTFSFDLDWPLEECKDYAYEIVYRHYATEGPITDTNICDIKMAIPSYTICWEYPKTCFSGQVTDKCTIEGVENAQIEWGDYQTQTDSQGYYQFQSVRCGNNLLQITHPEYNAYSHYYEPICESSNTKNLELDPLCPCSHFISVHVSPPDGAGAILELGQEIAVDIQIETKTEGVLQVNIPGQDVKWCLIAGAINTFRSLFPFVSSTQTGQISYDVEILFRHFATQGPILDSDPCDIIYNIENYTLLWEHGITTLLGKVEDAVTKLPVPGATVRWDKKIQVTNQNGEYDFDSIECKPTLLSVSAPEYQFYSINYTPPDCYSSNVHNIFLYKETQSKPMHISGKVKDGKSGCPLPGALVEIAGNSDTTDDQGYYRIENIDPDGDLILRGGKTGYSQYQHTLTITDGTIEYIEDFALSPLNGGNPVVNKIMAKYNGLFLVGIPLENEFQSMVDWNGTPGTVEFFVDETSRGTITGDAEGATIILNMGTNFPGEEGQFLHRVSAVATNKEGYTSEMFGMDVYIIDWTLDIPCLPKVYTDGTYVHIAFDFEFPYDPNPLPKCVIELPILGKFGVEFSANASFDYTVGDGDWEAAFGLSAEGSQGKRGRRPKIPGLTRKPRMKLYFGNKEATFYFNALARGIATRETGLKVHEAEASLGLSIKIELGRVGLPDLLGPGLSSTLSPVPLLGDLVKTVTIGIFAEPSISGTAIAQLDPNVKFKSLTADGDLALTAEYELDILKPLAELELYLGGKPGVTFQIFEGMKIPEDIIKELRFRAYAGGKFNLWVFTLGPIEYVFIDFNIPEGGENVIVSPIILETQSNYQEGIHPYDRSYRHISDWIFCGEEKTSELNIFRKITNADNKQQHQSLYPFSESPYATVTLANNIFPSSKIAMDSYESNIILIYVEDNGEGGSFGFTDINCCFFDGKKWISKGPINMDTNAEFNPQLQFDGNGNAVAVWQRVKNPDFNTESISAMASEMEIVWALWDSGLKQWSSVSPLTNNDYYDGEPLISDTLSNGDIILVWTINESNEIIGTGAPGSNTNSMVYWRRWNCQTQNWEIPSLLAQNITYRFSQTLAAEGQHGIYAWTQDMDGDPGTINDQEIFVCTLNENAWTPPLRITDDVISDRDVQATALPSGENALVWRRNDDIVMLKALSFDSPISMNRYPDLLINNSENSFSEIIIRENSGGIVFNDFELVANKLGQIALVWQDMSLQGTNAFYRLYHPESEGWSNDFPLTNETGMVRSLTPIWMENNALILGYVKKDVDLTTKVLYLGTGDQISIPQVPEPITGSASLRVLSRIFLYDVALDPTLSNIYGSTYLPGDEITIQVHALNREPLPVKDVNIGLYYSDGLTSHIIGTEIISGWLDGYSSVTVEAKWVVPEPAMPLTLFVQADSSDKYHEKDETNNLLSFPINGYNLQIRIINVEIFPEKSIRCILEVSNKGVFGSPETQVTLYMNGFIPNIDPIVIPPLQPGENAQISFDISEEHIPWGQTIYLFKVDSQNIMEDRVPENNIVQIILYRSIEGIVWVVR